MKFLQELLTRNNASLRNEKTSGNGKYTHFLDFNRIRIFFSLHSDKFSSCKFPINLSIYCYRIRLLAV